MQTYNDVSSAIFDFLLAPFGHEPVGFDLVVWPVLMGIGALQVYKYTSNQKAIARVKTRISMHLLEIRLFRDDIAQVIKSAGIIIAKNVLYIGHNLVPMAVMLAPMVAVMVQLVAHYAYAPSQPGSVELLHLRLDPAAAISSRDVSLKVPAGVMLDAPAVRTADGQVFWRVRADQVGDHVLKVKAGDETPESWPFHPMRQFCRSSSKRISVRSVICQTVNLEFSSGRWSCRFSRVLPSKIYLA
jgi:hypothetical protein